MTTEEAIKRIRSKACFGGYTNKNLCQWADEGFGECKDCANHIAIKSLEAWEKVKNDICEIDWYGDDVFWDGVNLVSDIIDKHLAEVET